MQLKMKFSKRQYDKLVAKANNIDTIGFVLKAKYDTDKSDFEKKISDSDTKISDTSGLVKKTEYNAETTETEGKITSINGLVTISALTAVDAMMQKYQTSNLNILLQLIIIDLKIK